MIFLQTGTGSLQYYKNIIPNPSRVLLFVILVQTYGLNILLFWKAYEIHIGLLCTIMIFITFALIDQKRHGIGCDHYQRVWWDNGAKVKLIAIREPSHIEEKGVKSVTPF